MKTVSINLYKYEELSKEVQEKVFNEFADSIEYYDDGIIEDMTHLLMALGFQEGVNISYSLDYSHYPFALVTGTFEKNDFTKAKQLFSEAEVEEFGLVELAEKLSVDTFEMDEISTQMDEEFADDVLYFMNKVNTFIFKQIEQHYEYYYSNESTLECLLAADCDFTEDGVVFKS